MNNELIIGILVIVLFIAQVLITNKIVTGSYIIRVT